jgi:hypothetical protein
MKAVFGINLSKSFEIYLLDMFNNKVQINLRAKMDHELLSSTRSAHIYSIEICEGMIIVATTNHNFMCFDEVDGSYIKVKSQNLYN